MTELSDLAGSEGYGACDDAAARAENSKKWPCHFFDIYCPPSMCEAENS